MPGLLVLIAAFSVGNLAAFLYRVYGPPPTVVTASGLKYVDLVKGHGATPRPGQMVVVHWKGSVENGQELDNTYQLGTPSTFKLGPSVIKGWEEGLMTMKVGGKRRLIIPAELGYGSAGNPPKIPPDATLIFEVELLEIKSNSINEPGSSWIID
jgi:peptidylprolyl isomerase